MKDAANSPKIVSFKKLPAEKKEQILRFHKQDSGDVFVFREKLPIIYYLIAAAALGWIAYLFYSSQNILWENWIFWLNAGLTLVAVAALVFSLSKIFAYFLIAREDGHIFTPNEFFRTKGDSIRIWNLKQLESLRVDEDPKQLEVWIGDHEERFDIRDFEKARRLEGLFDGWKLNAAEDFDTGIDDQKYAYSPAGKLTVLAGLTVISLLLTGGIVFAAKTANANYDEDVVWNLAERAGMIEDLEGYKARYPNGRHQTEANQKISTMLGAIKSDYVSKEKPTADPAAVEALTAVLDEIVQNADRRIYVKIKEERQLNDDVIKELESEFGLDVQSYEYTAPASNEEFRKGKVVTDLKLMLRDIVKDGAVEMVQTEDRPENKPFIEVNYVIKSAKMFYSYNLYFQGRNTLNFYPGLEFNYDFVLKSGTAAKEYRNTFSTVPKKTKSVVFNEKDVGNYTFDKNLFSVASEDFMQYLARQFGFVKEESVDNQ